MPLSGATPQAAASRRYFKENWTGLEPREVSPFSSTAATDHEKGSPGVRTAESPCGAGTLDPRAGKANTGRSARSSIDMRTTPSPVLPFQRNVRG